MNGLRQIYRLLGAAALGCLLAFGPVGCGVFSGGRGETIGSRVGPHEFYPAVGRVQHPDSAFHLDETRDQIRRRWSVSYRDLQGGRRFRTQYHRTFATLWSKELAMAEVRHRARALGMTGEAAEILIDEAADEYMDFLRFDLHVFVDARYQEAYFMTDLSALNAEFRLRDDRGNAYQPTRLHVSESDLMRGFSVEPDAFYRINTLYFPRIVEEKDILEDITSIELHVSTRRVPTATFSFGWQFR